MNEDYRIWLALFLWENNYDTAKLLRSKDDLEIIAQYEAELRGLT